MLTKQQYTYVTSEAQQVFFEGGVGTGKSYANGLVSYNWIAKLPGSVGLLVAPTYDVLRYATLPAIQNAWFEVIGLIEGIDYVINIKPPAKWGVKPLSSLHQGRVITFANGSYLVIDTADNFNKHRGAEYDYIIGDEWRDYKEGAYDVFLTRLRGKKAKQAGIKSQIFSTTTPPDDPDALETYTQNINGDIELIHSITKDNIKNLPSGYIEMLEGSLDELTFRREVLGEHIRMGNLAAWSFDPEKNKKYYEFNNNPIFIIYDFDFNPQVINIIQICGLTNTGENEYVVNKEFIMRPGNTITATENIINFLYSKHYSGYIVLTGDYAGKQRRPDSNTTSWIQIDQVFSKTSFKYEIKITPTISIRNSLNCVNALFNNYAGERRLFIDPDNAPYTYKDVKTALITSDGHKIDHGADNSKSHGIANLMDFAKNIHPIKKIITPAGEN